MRLLPLCVLALAGWVAAAAPGPRSEDTEEEGEDLGPALQELARRKRGTGSSKSNLPYSNYRPISRIHRYRYPLYRKRSSSRPQYQYDYEEDAFLPEVGNDYEDYEDYSRGPSLFRERNQQQDRTKKEMLIEDDGYFTDDYIPEKKVLPSPFVVPLVKKDTMYSLNHMPYDLQAIGRLYEMGKRDSSIAESPYDLEGLEQFHSVGRKNPPPSPTEQFFDAINSVRRKKEMYEDDMSQDEAGNSQSPLKLKNLLTSAAGRYYRARNAQQTSNADPMIRKKRETASAVNPLIINKPNATSNGNSHTRAIPTRYQAQLVTGDRKKRAFSDYFKWEKRAQSENKRNSKEYDDYLTREYFKSIARSVGQKKKRMAYAQFEAEKRSSGIDDFLENPAMLHYMQSKLREAEEEVAGEAEEELGNGRGDTQELLTNVVVRLDALQRMREALTQLEELQEQEDSEVRKRSSMSAAAASSRGLAQGKEDKRKRSEEGSRRKKTSNNEGRDMRRMRRLDDGLPAAFLGNTRDDCPVLDRILLNCELVSNLVGDQDQVFLDSCIRHEVCYMCGAGLSVSGHECNAILSSSLEYACSGTLECLSAAGNTYNLLSNANRYDDEGTCTHDPCVRQYLESR